MKKKRKIDGRYSVYLLLLGDKSVYTGITTDVERRFRQHKEGKGGRYTRSRKVIRILYTKRCGSRSSALKREAEIKSWKKEKKLEFVRGVHK